MSFAVGYIMVGGVDSRGYGIRHYVAGWPGTLISVGRPSGRAAAQPWRSAHHWDQSSGSPHFGHVLTCSGELRCAFLLRFGPVTRSVRK
jgi:hypothetical protein